MSPALRVFLIWAIGILLIVYLLGTLRLAWPLVTGQGTGGAPIWPILAGFYFRLVMMGIAFYVFLRLRRDQKSGK